jgi:hypothetical protein
MVLLDMYEYTDRKRLHNFNIISFVLATSQPLIAQFRVLFIDVASFLFCENCS